MTGGTARAETRSVDASVWAITGKSILVRVIEPDREWRQLPGTDGAPMTQDELGQYILGHYGARANGGVCSAVDLGFDIGKITPLTYTAGQRRYELILQCPSDQGIILINHALFTEVPEHANEALISVNNHPAVRQMFSAGQQEIAVASGGISPTKDFSVGWRNFFHSPDRVLFVLGVFALCGLGRKLGYAFAGLVAGRLIALAAIGTRLVEPIQAHSEWVVAFLLLLLAGELVGRRTAKAPVILGVLMAVIALLTGLRGYPMALPLSGALLGAGYLRVRRLAPQAHWLWVLPLALFGLADGVDYWPDLALLGAPAIGTMAAFNAATLVAALVLWALCRAGSKVRFAPRADWAAVALAGLGGFLVLTRL